MFEHISVSRVIHCFDVIGACQKSVGRPHRSTNLAGAEPAGAEGAGEAAPEAGEGAGAPAPREARRPAAPPEACRSARRRVPLRTSTGLTSTSRCSRLQDQSTPASTKIWGFKACCLDYEQSKRSLIVS